MGRELPPAEVLAADQRISARAHELRAAGLEGGLDELRARAYLDLLLGKDSRPRPGGGSGTAAPGDGGDSADGGGTGGFAVRGTLTVPLVTLAQLADRPGTWAGSGRSTRGWPGTWPGRRPGTRRRRGA